MAKIHVLQQSGDGGGYTAIVHYAVPTGNNSAGFTWKAAALSAGFIGSTILAEGTGPGQISVAEKAQVIAGDVVEVSGSIIAEQSVTDQADAIIADHKRLLSKILKWFGYTVA